MQHTRRNTLHLTVVSIPEEFDHACGRWLGVCGFIGEDCWKSDVRDAVAVLAHFDGVFCEAGEEIAGEMLESDVARGDTGDVLGTIACAVYLCEDVAS